MTRTTYDPGLHPDMPLDHYYADPAPSDHGSLNSSIIPVLRKRSPLHAAIRSPVLVERYGLEPAPDIDCAETRRGRVVHRLALGKGEEFEVRDYDAFRTAEAKAWKADCCKRGVTPVLEKDIGPATKQAALLQQHLEQMFMGEDYVTEVAVVWTEEVVTPAGKITVYCRALVDAWCQRLVHGCDLKSTVNASKEQCKNRIEQKGYDIQNRWYSRGLERGLGLAPGTVQFSTLFGETTPPYASQAFQITGQWESSAWDECQLALRTFAMCQAADRFPGYSVNPILLPPRPWLITSRMEAEMEIGDLDDEVMLPVDDEEQTEEE